MSELKDALTIVIFRGPTTKPLRIGLSRTAARRAAVVGIVLILAQLIFLTQYVMRTGEVWELRGFREEVITAREQTTAFSSALEDLKRRFLAMKEVNQRLRVMLGVEALKPEDYFNGQGGEETPLPEGESKTAPGQVPVGQSQPVDESKLESNLPEGKASGEKTLADRVQQEIAWLQHEVTYQERTMEELSEAATVRSQRWASTPSIWPVKGWVTSGFGPRISPFTGQLAMHDGLDIGAAPNTQIQAPAAGRVIAAGFDAGMGNVVTIDHGNGIQSQFGHLAKSLVKEGQRVKRGDVIALLGSTGRSTGPHLHYMLKVNNRTVNPQLYILN
jgi:murein DD-endopeptidase MepM/ murein hydrolase activator NlpD